MTVLTDDLARARSDAIRLLLAQPLIDQRHDPDMFRLIAQHRVALVEWFETTCGWTLAVDIRTGVARLVKRRGDPDPTRPAIRPRRSRAAQRPFDRRRYQLLCLLCADLVRRPATTIGLLAAELESVTTADPILTPFTPAGTATERRAFVDAVKLLQHWGAVTTSGGDVDAFIDDANANAIIEVDQTRLHLLLAAARSPSSLAADPAPTDPTALLAHEPRYATATAPADHDGTIVDEEAHNRRRRHAVARRLLDDPVVYFDDLDDDLRGYVTSQAGRQWLRDRLGQAGFELEERVEGWAAIDRDAIATDRVFPGPGDNVKQAALLLLDELATTDADTGERRLQVRTLAELDQAMLRLLDRYSGWAKQARTDNGHIQLVRQAVALLAELGLVAHGEGDIVAPRPLLARYTTEAPRTSTPTLFGGQDTP